MWTGKPDRERFEREQAKGEEEKETRKREDIPCVPFDPCVEYGGID